MSYAVVSDSIQWGLYNGVFYNNVWQREVSIVMFPIPFAVISTIVVTTKLIVALMTIVKAYSNKAKKSAQIKCMFHAVLT